MIARLKYLRLWLRRRGAPLRAIINGIRFHSSPFTQTYPPGHFYSTIPDIAQILEQKDRIFNRTTQSCSGVDLNEESQLALLEKLMPYYDDLPFSPEADGVRRYFFENRWFSYEDAIFCYAMLRHFKPARVIEVGCGFSSALMLDTDDAFLGSSTSFTFIDPFPERLDALLQPADKERCRILPKRLQDVDVGLFDELDAHDILFIDSSHVLKIGSDVARIMFEILPRLKPGVIVQFHDIVWPFEYPMEFVLSGTEWNEAYAVRAFLQYNNAFEVLFFVSFMGKFHSDLIGNRMPLCLRDRGGSLWLRRRV